ncbi:MAG TPA: hypothetical protein VKA04_08035 [Pseudodesulfovibrio sp.]|nr:hypothetical protein [Pseudodesulfovibrio sp.]
MDIITTRAARMKRTAGLWKFKEFNRYYSDIVDAAGHFNHPAGMLTAPAGIALTPR